MQGTEAATPGFTQPVAASQCAPSRFVAGHSARLRKANAKIRQATDEVLKASNSEPLQRSLLIRGPSCYLSAQDSEDGSEEEDQTDSDAEDPYKEDEGAWDSTLEANQLRALNLMESLNFDKRDEMLLSVRNRMRQVAATSQRDLDDIERLDQKQDRVVEEFKNVAQEVHEQIEARDQHRMYAMSHFKHALEGVKEVRKSVKRNTVQQEHKESVVALEQLSAMTDEDLEAAIEMERDSVMLQEREARELMLDMPSTERACRMEDVNGDVLVEQEKMMALMKETVRQLDGRGHFMKLSLDHLTGKNLLGDDGEESGIPPEANEVVKELIEEVRERLRPRLLAEREASHGHELLHAESTYVRKLETQCDDLAAGLDAAGVAEECLQRRGACEDDLQQRLEAVTEGQPPCFLMDTILEGLSGVSFYAADESDDETEEGGGGSVSFADVHDNCEDLKHAIRSGKDDQRERISKLIEASKEEDRALSQFERCQFDEKAVNDSFALIESHQKLFSDALAMARGTQLANSLPPQARQPIVPPLSEAAMCAVESVMGKALQPQEQQQQQGAAQSVGGIQVKPTKDETIWIDAFLSDMGDTFQKDSFQVQAEVTRAFVNEERQLGYELAELEVSFASQVGEIATTLEDETDVDCVSQIQACAEEGQQAIREVAAARQALSAAGATVEIQSLGDMTSRLELRPQLLAARRKAVETARALYVSGIGSAELTEVLQLEEDNRALSERIASLGDEVSLLRGRREVAKEEADKVRAELQAKAELARGKRRNSFKGADDDSALAAQLNAMREVPGSEDARSLRRECRLLSAFRAEVKALTALTYTRAKTAP